MARKRKPFHQAHRLHVISWCVEPVGNYRFCLAPLLWGCSYRTCDYTLTFRKRNGYRHFHKTHSRPNVRRLLRLVFREFLP